MPFPEFDPQRKKVLFFSRGRGRGHAVPDIEIVRQLQLASDDLDIRFASYATGARTIQEFGYPLVDLVLSESNGTAETTVVAGKLIGWLQPDLVIAHEEFAALPAAAIFDVPSLFLTDWFTDPALFSMQSLRFAGSILFLDEPGLFEEPKWVHGKVTYVGRVVRSFNHTRKHRAIVRKALGLPLDAVVISVFPGSWSERVAPLYDLLVSAFDALPLPHKHLLWLAGQDHRALARKTRGRTDITILEQDWSVDRLMVASDLAVTKGSRNTAAELAALGIRSITVSHGLNPVDDRCAKPLAAASLTPAKLARAIRRALDSPPPHPRKFKGAVRAAQAIRSCIEACTHSP